MANRRTEIQLKYDKTNCTFMTFKFNNKTDEDILQKLASVENRQGYVKQLIREDIAKGSQKQEMSSSETEV